MKISSGFPSFRSAASLRGWSWFPPTTTVAIPEPANSESARRKQPAQRRRWEPRFRKHRPPTARNQRAPSSQYPQFRRSPALAHQAWSDQIVSCQCANRRCAGISSISLTISSHDFISRFHLTISSHDLNLANGSMPSELPATVVATASEGLVAHAGNGNCTSSGIGISGWETIIVPGFKMLARSRVDTGRNPYSPCCASAVSNLPTTRK